AGSVGSAAGPLAHDEGPLHSLLGVAVDVAEDLVLPRLRRREPGVLRSMEAQEPRAPAHGNPGVPVHAGEIVRHEEALEMEGQLHRLPRFHDDAARFEIEGVHVDLDDLNPLRVGPRRHLAHRKLASGCAASVQEGEREENEESKPSCGKEYAGPAQTGIDLNTRHALVPPKPKEFEMTVRIEIERPTRGT